jgi:hypothetical protein
LKSNGGIDEVLTSGSKVVKGGGVIPSKGGSGLPTKPTGTTFVAAGKPFEKNAGTPAPAGVKSTEKRACYGCGQTGHIRPNCSLRTPHAAEKSARYKLGSMRGGPSVVSELDSNPGIRTLAVAVEVCGEMDFEEPLSMMMEIDTGAEINLVTYHAVPMLDLHGALVATMSETEIGWVRGATDARFMVNSYLVMDVKIAGTEDVTTLEFLVAPEHIVLENIVIDCCVGHFTPYS